MTAMGRHVESELGAYALGALELQEAARVDAHVQHCRRCRLSLDRYQAIAEGLLYGPHPLPPPMSVRAELTQRLGARGTGFAGSHRPSLRTIPLPAVTGLLVMAVVALSLVALQMQTSLRSVEDQVRAAQEAQEERARVDGVSLALLTYPARQVAMVSGDRAYGTFLFEPRLPMAVLNAWGLPEVGSAQVFQIWLVRPDGERVSAGLFVRDADAPFTRVLLDIAEPVRGFVGLGVTVEPLDGSPAPTGPKVLAADF
jgi:anti-sigma-K factor RskA